MTAVWSQQCHQQRTWLKLRRLKVVPGTMYSVPVYGPWQIVHLVITVYLRQILRTYLKVLCDAFCSHALMTEYQIWLVPIIIPTCSSMNRLNQYQVPGTKALTIPPPAWIFYRKPTNTTSIVKHATMIWCPSTQHWPRCYIITVAACRSLSRLLKHTTYQYEYYNALFGGR